MNFWRNLCRVALVCFVLLFALIYWAAEPSCTGPCATGVANRMPVIH